MSLSPRQQQELNDQSWKRAIISGQEIRSNIEVNLRFLEETQLLKSPMKAVELGCGTATLTNALYQKGIEIFGCDVSQVAIEHAHRKYPYLNLSAQNAEQLPWENGLFDAVLSFDVLEHLFHPDQHLMEVRGILKTDGYYFLGTPNKLVNVIFETMKTRSLEWRQYHPSLHFAGSLKRRLARHGFEVHFVKMNTINAFTLKKLEPYPRLRKLVKRLDFRQLPLWMQSNFYIVAQKK